MASILPRTAPLVPSYPAGPSERKTRAWALFAQMGLRGTMLWMYTGTMTAYLALAALGAWLMWRAARRDAFTVRSADGWDGWSKVTFTVERAEKIALSASLRHAPLEIVDGSGRVIGRLGLDLAPTPVSA